MHFEYRSFLQVIILLSTPIITIEYMLAFDLSNVSYFGHVKLLNIYSQ